MGQVVAYAQDESRAESRSRVDAPLLSNPLNAAIIRTALLFSKLPLTGLNVIPSLVTAVIFLFVLLVLFACWPIGWAPVIAEFLSRFVTDARIEMGKASTYPEKMPHAMAAGIMGVMWLFFTAVCIPFYVGGVVAELFAVKKPPARSGDSVA
jgi:hypothetical protein